MITVRYEKYYNDYRRQQERKSFRDLDEFADWLFDKPIGEYKRYMWFANPDNDYMRDGRLHLDSSCIKTNDGTYTYWIEQIESGGSIIYSTGKHTNGICHWNEEIKEWLRSCRNRMNNPQFNFG